MIMGMGQAVGLTDVPEARSMRNMLAPFMSVMLPIDICAQAMLVDTSAHKERNRRNISPPEKTLMSRGSGGTQMRRMVGERRCRGSGGDSVEQVRDPGPAANNAGALRSTGTTIASC